MAIWFQISRIAFWLFNACVVCVVTVPFLYLFADMRSWGTVTTFLDEAEYIGAALVAAAVVLWLNAFVAWFRTRTNRSDGENRMMLAWIIAGTVFAGYFCFLKRERIFHTLKVTNTGVETSDEDRSIGKRLTPALVASVFGVLLVTAPIVLWKLDHADKWPPVDPTSRYAYCELEGQVYVKVIDRNAYVIIEPGGPHLTFEATTDRISPEYEALLREKSPVHWSAEEFKKHSYNLAQPGFEIQIPSGEDPYRWSPDGRESMYECNFQMERDGPYQSKMYQLRLE